HVKVFGPGSLAPVASFFAYAAEFHGGVYVAGGDLNGDGVPDIVTGAGPGGGPEVRVFDGVTGTLLRSFLAYDASFTGGVRVAVGDVNGDGRADIITGPGPGGGPNVRVFDGRTGALLRSFFAYDPTFTGGVFVAAGDVNGDGMADIITGAGEGGGPNVRVFSGATGLMLANFFAYDPSFTGGVRVAAGDMGGAGRADYIITGPGPGAAPVVKVFDPTGGLTRAFFAYAPAFTGGVFVAAGDMNGDGTADIITGAGAGGGPQVKVFDGGTLGLLANLFAYVPAFLGGVTVGASP
ncbi:MAG TPA: VCBS repeat-containing protein, partial [Methylomirabilota bacterium]|nr:VCBS repeat-containing protein [Methylomirabilota bacterium]